MTAADLGRQGRTASCVRASGNGRAAGRQRAGRAEGFTLLEVMVALAILGLALTAILSAQAGLYNANVQARNLTVATSAARCKMSEVEIQLLSKGYPEADQAEEGACCSEDSPPGMTCKWNIERVVLPDPPQQDLTGDAGTSSGDGGGPLGPLGALAGAMTNPSAALGDAGLAGLSSMLASGSGPNGQAGVSGIAGMAMTMVYPNLKPLLEASIRRVTVDVTWNEGPNARSLRIVQFVTNPQKGLPPFDPTMLGGQPGAMGAGSATPGGQPKIPTGGGMTPSLPGLPR